MSRIDVVPAEKGKIAVLVNFGATARFEYSSKKVANNEARKIHRTTYPHCELHLIIEIKE